MSEKTWFKFFPDKWMGDLKLRVCSHSARALLIDLMAMSFPTGYFKIPKGREKKLLLAQLGFTPRRFERSLTELCDLNRVNHDLETDTFSVPKMVQDHKKYLVFSKLGKLGAEAKAKANPLAEQEKEQEQERERANAQAEKDSPKDFF